MATIRFSNQPHGAARLAKNAEALFEAALERVESKSIRAWATSQHNRPIWLDIAKRYVGKDEAEIRLATDITATAIGLW